MTLLVYLAVVLEGGLVQIILSQEWPAHIPPPRVVIVDYDIDGVDKEDLTHFSIGGKPMIALCRSEMPESYEDLQTALSPKAIWAALDDGGPEDSGGADAHENRVPTRIEQSLSDYLTGYVGKDPVRREDVRDCPDWPCLARRELDRRRARILEDFSDEALAAIARGEVDLAGLAGKIPG
jgi:hypothetical protein